MEQCSDRCSAGSHTPISHIIKNHRLYIVQLRHLIWPLEGVRWCLAPGRLLWILSFGCRTEQLLDAIELHSHDAQQNQPLVARKRKLIEI